MIIQAKKTWKVFIKKWQADKKKEHNKFINTDNLVPQIIKASYNQSAIANFSNYAFCDLLDSS